MAEYNQLSALLGKKKKEEEPSDPQLRAGMAIKPTLGSDTLKTISDLVLGETGGEDSMPDPTKPEQGLRDVGMLNPIDYLAGAAGSKLAAKALSKTAAEPVAAEATKTMSRMAPESPAVAANLDKELKIKALKDTIQRYDDPKNWQTMDDVLQRAAANEELQKLVPEIVPQKLRAVPDLPPISEVKYPLQPHEFIDDEGVRDIILPTKEQLKKTAAGVASFPALQELLKKKQEAELQ